MGKSEENSESSVLAQLQLAKAAPPAPSAPAASDEQLYSQDFTAFENKTLEQKVQELADREEIRELISRYAHRIARGISVADLFTEDGAYLRRAPGHAPRVVQPRSAIEKMYAGTSLAEAHPMPMIHNYLLAINGDEATGLCSNELRITENGESIIASGYYEDKLRRDNGRWKFVVRDANFFHWVPIQQGWATPQKQK